MKLGATASKHDSHEVYVDIFPRDKKGNLITTHSASLRCRKCNKWIKWLSVNELFQLPDLIPEDQQ